MKAHFALTLVLPLVGVALWAQQAGVQSPTQPAPKNSPSLDANKSVEILSDTRGVDFGPYLLEALSKIKENWYKYIPAQVRSPQFESGKTTIELKILPDGRLAGVKLVDLNGNSLMDQAAWAAMAASIPFDPLPTAFRGPFLALRIHFLYNPGKEEKIQYVPDTGDSRETAPSPR